MKSKLKVLGLLLTIACFTFISLSLPKFQYFIIYSGSMEPNIPKGSLVIAKNPLKNNLEHLKVGDVITFYPNKNEPNSLITHRIQRIDKTIFTKGDFNPQPDLWTLDTSQIRGIYALDIPYLGYLLHFIRTYPWYLAVILGLIITFPLDKELLLQLKPKQRQLGKALAFLLPFLIIFWSNPALAQWKSKLDQSNYIATDSIYKYLKITAGTNVSNNGTPVVSGQEKNLSLDFGTLNKPTTFSDVIGIQNTSTLPVALKVNSDLALFSLAFGADMLPSITLNPQESTTLVVTINPLRNRNKQLYQGKINLFLNNSSFFLAKIPTMFYDK